MTDTLTYHYKTPSNIQPCEQATPDYRQLFLSDYSEISTPKHFFFGKLADPFIVSRCLLVLSDTVQASFNLSPFQIALLKDPIVTVGNSTIRFEGFSHCAGVYIRTDIVSGGFYGEILASGTTNVDFNPPMIATLGAISRNNELSLSVGKDQVEVMTDNNKVIERKVPLPNKWIKGLTSVQYYLANSELCYTLNKVQTLQLFRSIPKGTIKNDYYLIKRGNKYLFSPVKSNLGNSVVIGGLHRLHLLTPLLPLLNQLKIFTDNDQQSVTFQLYFNAVVLSFTLSRDVWRGFSGEGALLEELLEDLPQALIEQVNQDCVANQSFSDFTLALTSSPYGANFANIDNLTAKLSAMGLLGFSLDDKRYFYRQLPFKLSRIISLNPRLKGVEKLLANNQVQIISNDGQKVEAQVIGSGVTHRVILDSCKKNNGKQARCTCTWFSQNQGERGACKHILAVKKMIR